MNSNDYLKALLRNGSKDFQRLNAGAETPSGGLPAQSQSTPVIRGQGKNTDKAPSTGRFLVSITDYRRRLLDEDGFVQKYHIDALRYAGFLPQDSPRTAHILTPKQIQVGKSEAEFVEIELWKIE